MYRPFPLLCVAAELWIGQMSEPSSPAAQQFLGQLGKSWFSRQANVI
jgi:hypothetical protein